MKVGPPKKLKVEKFQNGPVLKKQQFCIILFTFYKGHQGETINGQPMFNGFYYLSGYYKWTALDRLYPNGDGIFVQDGANAHTSNLVPQYLHGFVNK